jgi:hypothetical protein
VINGGSTGRHNFRRSRSIFRSSKLESYQLS